MEVFRTAIQNILDDDSYKLNPASPAAEARRIAESLLKWSLNERNNEKVHEFVKTLFDQLDKPIIASIKKSCNREKLWRNYFLLRSSRVYKVVDSIFEICRFSTKSDLLPASH